VVGEEAALVWLGVEKQQHKGILMERRYRAKKQMEPVDLDIQAYQVFDDITAGAKGFTGIDRILLQEIGGLLI
jgi:hypothetical protein